MSKIKQKCSLEFAVYFVSLLQFEILAFTFTLGHFYVERYLFSTYCSTLFPLKTPTLISIPKEFQFFSFSYFWMFCNAILTLHKHTHTQCVQVSIKLKKSLCYQLSITKHQMLGVVDVTMLHHFISSFKQLAQCEESKCFKINLLILIGG